MVKNILLNIENVWGSVCVIVFSLLKAKESFLKQKTPNYNRANIDTIYIHIMANVCKP